MALGTYTTNEQGSTGDSVNDLVAISGDPNVTIQESKAFRCDVRAGRRKGETTERLAGAGEGEHHPPGESEAPDRVSQAEKQPFLYGGANREI